MKIKILIFLLGSLVLPTFLSAQLSKGTWMVNGQFDFFSTKNQSPIFGRTVPVSAIFVQPQVSFFVSPKFQLSSELEISVVKNFAVVGQKMGGRYYFGSDPKNKFFGGLVLGWRRSRSLFATGGLFTQNFNTRLDLGLNHFMNKNVALEFSLEYNFLIITRVKPLSTRNNINNGGMYFRWQMQYFFESRLAEDKWKEARNFKKGLWMIGGHAILGDVNFNNLDPITGRKINDISPFLAYFLNEHWAVGASFHYHNDLRYQQFNMVVTPMTRYYLNINHKRKIFGELAIGLGMDFWRSEKKWNARNNILKPKLSFGVANMLSNYVSLDIWIDYEQMRVKEFYTRNRKISQTGIHMGIQAYFD